MNKKQMGIYEKAYNRFEVMADRGLEKGLTHSDYDVIYGVFYMIRHNNNNDVHVVIKNVADWFRKNKFKVQESGIGWTISLP